MAAIPLLTQTVIVRRAEVADAAALLELHNVGFGSDWGMRHWRWRYLDNPLRALEVVGAFLPDGRCVASFCGVPLPCHYGGDPALVQRAGDVTVHPQLRKSLAGPSLLLRTGAMFFREYGGGPTRMAFGFAQPELSRAIVRHCRLEIVGDVLLLVRDAAARGAPPSLPTTSGPCVPVDVDALTSRWQAGISSGIVRDGRYLRWRYETNPHADYVFVATRGPVGELRGLAVVRRQGLDPESVVIVEWIVPRGDHAAEGSLLSTVADVAQAAGRPNVVAGFAAASPEFARFQRPHGFHVQRSPYQFAFRSFARGVDRRFLAERWFQSLGDLDFT